MRFVELYGVVNRTDLLYCNNEGLLASNLSKVSQILSNAHDGSVLLIASPPAPLDLPFIFKAGSTSRLIGLLAINGH